MSYPVFHVPAGDVLPIFFSSYGKTNGESITLTGLAVTDIEIYKDGSATQRASDAGVALLDTDGIDFDGITGIHGFQIDTGDNTDAGFYTVGAWFLVVVSSVTVDGSVVSFPAAMFRIMPAESVAGKPKVDVDAFGGTAGTFASGRPDVNAHNLGTQAKADVNAEVVDGLATDTYAEPGQETPGATVSLARKIGYLYKAWRNRQTQDATTWKLYADDATTVDQKATIGDSAGTFDSSEKVTGP